MPDGGVIEISAENTSVTDDPGSFPPPGRYVKISVRDYGIGIPEKHLRAIFDPYFTTQPAGKTKGTGLGLSLAHSAVRRHGGHIAVESAVGAGTTTHIYLPAAAEEARFPQKPHSSRSLPRRGKASVSQRG